MLRFVLIVSLIFCVLSVASSRSSYQQSSTFVKSFVSGLTNVFNRLANARNPSFPTEKRTYRYKYVTPQRLKAFIREDFERNYLFSGAIDPEIYDSNCLFTDPTISFRGLDTFERNIQSIKPLIDRFVGENEVVLYSLASDSIQNTVTANWRMSGAIRLPWRPRIELTGSTQFTYDRQKEGRVIDYFETWDTQAGEVLLQLLKPYDNNVTQV